MAPTHASIGAIPTTYDDLEMEPCADCDDSYDLRVRAQRAHSRCALERLSQIHQVNQGLARTSLQR